MSQSIQRGASSKLGDVELEKGSEGDGETMIGK
jgi:hypothetical protein